MELKYDGNQAYYDGLPEGWKEATIHDFFEGDDLLLNMPFLTHSEVTPNKFWATRTKIGFQEYNDFYLFLEKGRIYVIK